MTGYMKWAGSASSEQQLSEITSGPIRTFLKVLPKLPLFADSAIFIDLVTVEVSIQKPATFEEVAGYLSEIHLSLKAESPHPCFHGAHE